MDLKRLKILLAFKLKRSLKGLEAEKYEAKEDEKSHQKDKCQR